MEPVYEYIHKGGIFMYPIIGGAIWALTLLCERAIFYIQTASRLSRQTRTFFGLLERDGPGKAHAYATSQRGILAVVLQAALDSRALGAARIEEKVETVLLGELPIYSRYFNLIATLTGLMPILGLLGTVTGMISTFKVIALAGTGDAQAMADGIAEALITTQAGLVAAVPLLLGHTLLSTRLQKITETIHSSSARLIDFLKEHNA